MFVSTNALAHRPYDRPTGSFERNDGVTIFIVKHYIDGIVFADPVSVQFRHADGVVIASTSYTTDAVVWGLSSKRKVYQFFSSWLPIASHVHEFDGYSLVEITSFLGLIMSPLAHAFAHSLEYLSALGVWSLLIVVWRKSRSLPWRGLLAGLKILGGSFVILVGALCGLVLLYAPISPLLLFLLGITLSKSIRVIYQACRCIG